MGKVTVRTIRTSGGFLALSPWGGDYGPYDYSAINLGNNFIAKLEIVSSLNSFNISHHLYHFNYINCPEKYNPKVYFGTIQSVSFWWLYDNQTGQTNGLANQDGSPQKSGSCYKT
ncbi:MAG TPA: hypothetical protein DCY93_03180 [Firmicutes bacterium]|nr:hypothetical protein [Bacillota bacterium]